MRSVPYGEDFPDYIDRIVANCQVLLAVIGPGWLAEIKRRLETGEKDWVREELECAFDKGDYGDCSQISTDFLCPVDVRSILR